MPPEADDFDIDPAFRDRLARIISQLDATDFERVDPPDALWGRIAAAVTAESARAQTQSGTVVLYSINADDVVIAVDEGWTAFARDNDAPELVELDPARTLWSYFDNDETRDLWRVLIQQVRAKQAQAHVPLRCDAPHMRRWFEMTITSAPNGAVHFRSLLVFEQPRPSVSLLGRRTERNNETPAIPVCSWCGKAFDGFRWDEIEELARDLRLLEDLVPSITYGICPTCRDLMSADLLVSEETRSSPRSATPHR
ncbi:MAG: hypothetical protein ABI658_22040 [Acidimicrobiales bacterium]